MKATRKMMAMLGGALLAASAVAAPSVEITAVQQQYPWTNTVDITYEVQGVTNMEYFVRFTPTTSDDKEILDVNGEPSIQVALTNNGTYVAQWYPQTNLQYTACKMTPAIFRGGSGGGNDYMIVDLLTGTVTYEPMATQEASNERYNTVEYKTTKMVFRKINAGEYDIMDGTLKATMSKDYYVGIFEVTEGQYNAIVGSGSTASRLAKASISWGTIRSSALPAAKVADTGSGPIAKLNQRVHAAGSTDLYFDLPTEAMWEVASRANCPANWCRYFGTTSITDGSGLANYAWYNGAQATKEVGLKVPNAWGLYDTLGNAWEFCRDAVGSLNGRAANDATGLSLTQSPATSGSHRIIRGGGAPNAAHDQRCACRNSDPSVNSTWTYVGFRLALIVE